MKTEIRVSRQQGMALIISLLLLYVLLILGVAGFSNTAMQERSAGNARLQVEALKAASAGAVNSINFFEANRDRTDINKPDDMCGSLGHEGWLDGGGNPVPTDWIDQGQIGEATLRQRMYCLADAFPCGPGDPPEECGIRPPRSQLFVQSRGEITLDGRVVAMRDIEVRLLKGKDDTTGQGCAAICFPNCDFDALNFPSSNSFQIDGSGGPAITVGGDCGATGPNGEAQQIIDAIRDNRIGNYEGGIEDAGPGYPWDDPDDTEAFRDQIKRLAELAQAGNCSNCYFPGNHSNNGNSTYGTNENPQITYIEGDASFGGNISGAGIMFVNGNLSWNGTPNFRGLIVTLGGNFHIDGGGRGGNPGDFDADKGGSIVILDAPGGVPAADFGDSSFTNQGGGTGFWRFDCSYLWFVHDELLVPSLGGLGDDDDSSGDAESAGWEPQCIEEEDIPFPGPDRTIIASWRENIGWREEIFGD